MSNFAIEPLFVLAALMAVSFFIGMPLAYYFTRPLSTQGKNNVFVFTYVAALFGYGQLHLASFLATQFAGRGTNAVVLPVTLVSAAIALFFLFWAKERVLPSLKFNAKPLAIFFVLLLLATAHVMFPVVIGKWEMAYATGDDASRWYMVVNYFQTHVFDYMQVTEETLKWGMRERPLQNISGAIIASLFHTQASFAYSVSSASALVMAVIGFCLVYEGMFGIVSQKSRYTLWIITALFFSVFGSFINIFYTGRITHHFSMYSVIAALGFVAIRDEGLRRFWWYCLWSILLAYIYSIRFSVNFIGVGIAIVFFQLIGKEIGIRAFVKNAAGLVFSFFVASIAAYQELKAILESLKTQGMFFLMLQRDPGYGADGTLLDRIFKWSGFIGTYESHESIPLIIQLGLFLLILLVFSIAFTQAVRSFRHHSSYTGLFLFSLFSAITLFVTQNFYVAWKLALYWPSYVLLGYLAFALNLSENSQPKLRLRGKILLTIAIVYIILTARQFFPYFKMVDERYTKVDQITNEMQQEVARYFERCQGCKRDIFGFDLSTERHLLLREIFRGYPWQPIRGKKINFENDMASKHPENFDQYRYGVLLYAKTYKCEPFDFSGNRDALLYDNFPFQIFGARSSLLEPISGIEMRMYGPYDETRHCPVYGGEMTDNTARLVFANNGAHSWLDLTLRVYGGGSESLDQSLALTATAGTSAVENLGRTQDYSEYRVHVYDLQDYRLVNLNLARRGEGRIILTQTKWGR